MPFYIDNMPLERQLRIAVVVGCIERVRDTLKRGGANVDAVFGGKTVLHQAIVGDIWGDGGYPEAIEILLASGADTNRRLPDDKAIDNPLYAALLHYRSTNSRKEEKLARRKKVIEVLLDFGALLPERIDPERYKHPLSLAGRHCDRRLVKRLMDSEMDLSRSGSDSIPIAIGCGEPAMIRLLLDNGAEITPGFVKWTLGGVNKPWKAEIAHWLLDAGVDPGEYRFVRFALAWKDYDLLKRALDGGASPDKFLKPSINIPLVYSALGNDLQAVEILLEYGADTGAKWREKTASEWAREDGYDEIARLIEQRTSNAASK